MVYGEPAIAVPISSLRAYAEVAKYDVPFQIVARDLNDKIIPFDAEDALAQVVRLTLEMLRQPVPNIQIAVSSKIPIASGLGSGAAISTAVVRLLCDYFDADLSLDVINSIVFEVEKIHHGTPSGIDNTVIVHEQPIYYVKQRPIEMINNAVPLRIVVGDTGMTALTKQSVGDVRKLYETRKSEIKPILTEIGSIVQQARQAMQLGDVIQLGNLMNDNHAALQQLTVSSDTLDILVDVARDAGAYGAKLSGGGRGGNMIALVHDDSVANVVAALKKAGAVRVFETVVKHTMM